MAWPQPQQNGEPAFTQDPDFPKNCNATKQQGPEMALELRTKSAQTSFYNSI